MSYSLDLRRRVVLYVQDGGTKISASRQFKVSLWCVNDSNDIVDYLSF